MTQEFHLALQLSEKHQTLLRLDYNISEDHKLTLRNNFVTGFADNLEWTPTVLTLVIKGTNTIQQLIVSLPN
jgi:hypothetical protein